MTPLPVGEPFLKFNSQNLIFDIAEQGEINDDGARLNEGKKKCGTCHNSVENGQRTVDNER